MSLLNNFSDSHLFQICLNSFSLVFKVFAIYLSLSHYFPSLYYTSLSIICSSCRLKPLLSFLCTFSRVFVFLEHSLIPIPAHPVCLAHIPLLYSLPSFSSPPNLKRIFLPSDTPLSSRILSLLLIWYM